MNLEVEKYQSKLEVSTKKYYNLLAYLIKQLQDKLTLNVQFHINNAAFSLLKLKNEYIALFDII